MLILYAATLMNSFIIPNSFCVESFKIFYIEYHCCCLVTQSCLILCNPMNCSTPGFPVLHSLIICWNSCSLSQWCHPAFSSSVTPFSSCPQSLPTSGSFPMSQLFTLGGQSFEASALSWVLPMNIQGQFPSRLNVICIKWQFYLFPSNRDNFYFFSLSHCCG